jgi:HAMP domain-containing protein
VTPFRDLPIRRKLLVMTLSSSAAALVLATAGFLVWDIVQFHTSVQRDLAAQMRLLSDNSALAIPLRDVETATETLSVLQEQRRVAKACLYDGAGTLFARYERSDGEPCPGRLPDTAGSLLAWDELDLVLPVHSREARVGTMYVTRDLVDLHERLQVGVVLVGALLVLAIGTAWVTAARMQRSIASPLLQLADTARRVSATRDYALRATPTSRDEVGVVVHAFNDMLDRITERTDALSRTNAELAREIEERRRVEAERTAALERERDANRLKDEFLATLSHELRTPLNAVLGWTRILRAASLEPAMQARALESIERNARAQARLVEDLLEISRIVTGKLRLAVQDSRSRHARRTRRGGGPPGGGGQTPAALPPHRLAAGAHDGRSRSAAADLLEPALERGEVHPGRGRRGRRARHRARRLHAARARHGPGHRSEVPAVRLRALPAGRRLAQPATRRARARPRHRQAARRTARRNDPCQERGHRGLHVRGTPPFRRRRSGREPVRGPASDGPRAPGGRRWICWPALTSSSSTTRRMRARCSRRCCDSMAPR